MLSRFYDTRRSLTAIRCDERKIQLSIQAAVEVVLRDKLFEREVSR
jgi:hypothetical protein